MSKIETKHCDLCKHLHYYHSEPGAECGKGHKLRFYKPRYVMDTDWGYKRRCEDYESAAKKIIAGEKQCDVRTLDDLPRGDL